MRVVVTKRRHPPSLEVVRHGHAAVRELRLHVGHHRGAEPPQLAILIRPSHALAPAPPLCLLLPLGPQPLTLDPPVCLLLRATS